MPIKVKIMAALFEMKICALKLLQRNDTVSFMDRNRRPVDHSLLRSKPSLISQGAYGRQAVLVTHAVTVL